MFKLLVAFKVLGGYFPVIVIGLTIYELKNKIVELVKIRIGDKEDATMKNVITVYYKKVELVADMGNSTAEPPIRENKFYISAANSLQKFIKSIY